MTAGHYVVRLTRSDVPCWVSPCEGDPGRTCVLESAALFGKSAAKTRAARITRHGRAAEARLLSAELAAMEGGAS